MRRFDETWEYEKWAGLLNDEELMEREREQEIIDEQREAEEAVKEDAWYEHLHGLDK